MAKVTVVHWNPARPVLTGRLGSLVPWRRRINNFGDLLGPVVVGEVLRRRGIDPSRARADHRLLCVGSILKLARDGDTLWGIGANGKSLDTTFAFTELDVRAVRGPLTRDFLLNRGIAVPAVYGDPGLLVGVLWTRDELRGSLPDRPLTVIPNLNDLDAYRVAGIDHLDPRSPLDTCLATIAASGFVTGSSLHAIVVAEALGIPARLVRSGSEPLFKYQDYYRGSGRRDVHPAGSVAEAVEMGGEPPVVWDPEVLLKSFPADLWSTSLPSPA